MKNENFITKIRTLLIDNTSLTQCFSPALPQDGDNIACVTLLGGSTSNNLDNKVDYSTIAFRTLIRGTESDTTTRKLADDIFNTLHLLKDVSFTGGKIINCIASGAPVYVGKDENQRILYNITFNAIIK